MMGGANMDKINRRRKVSRGLLLLALTFYIVGAIVVGGLVISGEYTVTVGIYGAFVSFIVFLFLILPGFLLSPGKSANRE